MDINSRIFVAGHTGLVGSSIVRQLERQGYKKIIKRTHSELDLIKEDDVEKLFEAERPDFVFMAAAKVGGIKFNSKYPADFLMDNLMIQNNIISSCKKYDVKKMLFLASSCCYPTECQQPIKEEYLLTGPPEKTNEGYALAKIAGIKTCYYFNKQYNTNYISVMPANCYGINDCFDIEKSHVIPALIKRCHEAKNNKDKEIILWGTGEPLREFLFADDLADACIFLMNNYHSSDLINIGSSNEVSIKELAEIIRKVVGFEGNIKFDTTKPDGMMRRIVDSTKLDEMGWKAKTPLEDGINVVYKWFLESYCK